MSNKMVMAYSTSYGFIGMFNANSTERLKPIVECDAAEPLKLYVAEISFSSIGARYGLILGVEGVSISNPPLLPLPVEKVEDMDHWIDRYILVWNVDRSLKGSVRRKFEILWKKCPESFKEGSVSSLSGRKNRSLAE